MGIDSEVTSTCPAWPPVVDQPSRLGLAQAVADDTLGWPPVVGLTALDYVLTYLKSRPDRDAGDGQGATIAIAFWVRPTMAFAQPVRT